MARTVSTTVVVIALIMTSVTERLDIVIRDVSRDIQDDFVICVSTCFTCEMFMEI